MKIKIPLVVFIFFIAILFFGLFIETKVIQSPLIGKKLPNYELVELNTGYKSDIHMLPNETFLLNGQAKQETAITIKDQPIFPDVSKDDRYK
jgi:hypothetical protein